MNKGKPLKRHAAFYVLSHGHHDGLILCWKIRSGLSKKINPMRIKSYTNWFYSTQLLPHFEMEEKVIFPLLDADHELVKKALADHRRLRRLFEDKEDVNRSLSRIEEELEDHIRFEERVLFEEIQRSVSMHDLENLASNPVLQSNATRCDWEDEFWKER
ncbi:MAG TPA: hemerythrin domain-containing protein [Cyclobacteriaceae bacterium]|nr:hemerythrin domain-containing protein [Cyclobacteriaceae bacterium]